MTVSMTFDAAKTEANGYQLADLYQTIKAEFMKRGLRCSSENEVLAFEDTGGEHDYAQMWNVIINLLMSEWFVACASSCIFVDDDDTEEDVLSQAWKVQQHLV